MESRKDTLTMAKMCRFCLTQTTALKSLYSKSKTNNDALSLKFKVLSCLAYEVFPSDRMPTYICDRCKFFMNSFYEFKKICRQSEELVLKFIRSGKTFDPVTWPKMLSKVYDSSKDVVNTIVEGGTTVQVSSQDTSESEDEEANVYNIQIGDDDEAKTTQVKIVTTDNVETKQKKGFGSVSKLSRHLRTHAGERPYPCKYCSKSFIKSQHYTRHLRVKHRDEMRTSQSSDTELYRCDQCEETFANQDELIFHSAVHATQNLTCPLCQERFDNVDDVTTHIKSHVNGDEFMCEFCELVFTTKEKYENHLMLAHEEEIHNAIGEESSMEVDEEDYDDDEGTIVKEDGDSVVLEIKKADNDSILMPEELQADEDEVKADTNSEASENELPQIEATIEKISSAIPLINTPQIVAPLAEITQVKQPLTGNEQIAVRQEEKRKIDVTETEPVKKIKAKTESNTAGFTDKSLRLLEKELQDLKRTTARSDFGKSTSKMQDLPKIRRTHVITSTPKLKSYEDRKQFSIKSNIEKKFEKRLTKENKEPHKEEKKDNKDERREEEKNKDVREIPKSLVKNGSDKSDEAIRRSSRPSRVKDYAKMAGDLSKGNSEEDSDSEEDDEEYTEGALAEMKMKRRASVKTKQWLSPATPTATPTPRKRGRPRKDASKEVPEKVRKEDASDAKESEEKSAKKLDKSTPTTPVKEPSTTERKSPSADVILSPTGQTLKKVPIKALPPGVKPLPLPVNARPQRELCEMQIGKKVVKVQKIVMSKSDVEAMAKQGLLEMKDGNMVLKQGIKLPANALSKEIKESPKRDKAAPTRCDIGE